MIRGNARRQQEDPIGLEIIAHGGIRYAEIIRADVKVEKTTFFSPAESSFQFGLLAHEAGFVEPPHYHREFERAINDLQQMFVVQRGVVAVELLRRRRRAAPRSRLARGRRDRSGPRRALRSA